MTLEEHRLCEARRADVSDHTDIHVRRIQQLGRHSRVKDRACGETAGWLARRSVSMNSGIEAEVTGL
jgi:hypothetical protein